MSAVVGGGIWLAFVVGVRLDQLEALFLLAPLVLVPLLLRLAVPGGGQSSWYRYAVFAQPVGAALVALSFTVGRGLLAGLLVVPWFVVTVAVAVCGLERLLVRGVRPLSELAVNAGLLYIVVGSGWLFCSRFGLTPLGFGELIVFFTAVHFHYAGFALPILAGVTGRVTDETGVTGRVTDGNERYQRVYAVSAVPIVFGPGLIAAGITLSPLVEIIAVTALTSGVVVFALLTLYAVVPTRTNRLQQAVLAVSSLAVAVSMLFALGYGLSEFLGRTLFGLGISRMISIHGHLNALGFALCGALGWSISVPSPDSQRVPPLSSLTAGKRVGENYLERNDIVGPASPRGQMDDLGAYARPGFDPDSIHTEIRRFYEQTEFYELSYEVEYHPGFRIGGWIGSWVTSQLEQLNLPGPDSPQKQTDSRIVDVDDGADGRTGVRAWIRTDTETETAVFVAAYTTHDHNGETYMNIGLPLPFCNLSAVLWMESLDSDGDNGIQLSSRHHAGDEGIYLVTPLAPIRLPMAEEFRVWPASAAESPGGDTDATLTAEHDMWLFGRRFLTITYTIERTTRQR